MTTLTTVANPAQRYLDHLTACVELAAARAALREIITLADQAPMLTGQQLRCRLLALPECAALRPSAAPRSPIGRWLSEAPDSAPGGRSAPVPRRPGWLPVEPRVPGSQPVLPPAPDAHHARYADLARRVARDERST